MKKLLMITIACALLAVYGCEQAAQTPESSGAKQVDIAAIKAQLQKEQQAYAQAWCNKDMNAISEIWSHDNDIGYYLYM